MTRFAVNMLIALLILIGVGSLTGCAYSAKSEVVIDRIPISSGKQQLDGLLKALSHHYDGCYSTRNATTSTQNEKGRQVHLFRVNDTSVELRVALQAEGGQISVTLDEWAEQRFTPEGARCYKQMLKVLKQHFGSQNMTISETCEGACIRK